MSLAADLHEFFRRMLDFSIPSTRLAAFAVLFFIEAVALAEIINQLRLRIGGYSWKVRLLAVPVWAAALAIASLPLSYLASYPSASSS